MRASPPPDERGQLHTAVLTAAELLRLLGCALVGTAAVAWGVAIFLGASFPTGISLAENCPNAIYRTGPSAALPDCRAYELVSPPEKNGGYINQGLFSISPEGSTALFTSNSGFAGATSDLDAATGYQSIRSSTGWETTAQTENEDEFINKHSATDKDNVSETFGNYETRGDLALEKGIRLWRLQEVGQPEADLDLYLTESDGVNKMVGPTVPPTATGLAQSRSSRSEQEEIGILGMSADASHIVFEDPEQSGPNQWAFAAPGALLEYPNTSVAASAPEPVVPDPAVEDNECPSQQLAGTTRFANVANPISTHGEKIFFTDTCQKELFARVESSEERAHTVAISEPTKEDCSACEIFEPVPGKPEFGKRASAEFLGASEDGSKVFFYTSQPLLNGEGGLYEYDFAAAEGKRVLQVASGGLPPIDEEPEEPRVLISQDGSHAYFLSEAILTDESSSDAQGGDAEGNPVPMGSVAQLGAKNIYCFERDEHYPQGHLAFVATLSSNEPKGRNFSLTPDGRFLVLNVQSDLTSDDSSTTAQVFEYDAQTGSLVRVSIGANGYNDNGNGNDKVGNGTPFDASIPTTGTAETAFNPSSFMGILAVSEDGAYVFFQSADGLTPQALNRVVVGSTTAAHGGVSVEPAYAQNVYEYHAGHVNLISDGQDLSSHKFSSVHFLSTNLSGHDVFFETTDQLVGQDTDSNKDIYDARIDGGFPAPVRPVSCSGDPCQGQLSPSPVLLSPGSEFQAGGNPAPGAPAPAPAVVTSKPKALTNAQRLAVALKTCKKTAKKQQAKCEAAARKKYTAKRAKKSRR